jgi:hypothetical protein
MQTSGQINKANGMAQVAQHHEATVEAVLEQLAKCRQHRLKNPRTASQKWTVEELIKLVDTIWNGTGPIKKIVIPTKINGLIGSLARKRGIIRDSGGMIEAKREERHCNKVPLVEFVPDNIETARKP